ncbi:MAG: hypothetical protein Q4C47_08010, partial [Planctomycetia bacterium]|nr:hypothetical protein [Planctomycetia bacterium]
ERMVATIPGNRTKRTDVPELAEMKVPNLFPHMEMRPKTARIDPPQYRSRASRRGPWIRKRNLATPWSA